MLTNTEWQAWAKRDPLWGVASWPGRERGGPHPWTDAEFYALGQDWLDYDRIWQATVSYTPGTVLEIGCGAGRMTQMLAKSFDQVIAVDVAPDIVAYASARVTDANVVWRIGNGDVLPATDAVIDAVFSCHVVQHFLDNAAQLRMFGEMARVLKPAGTFLVHLPLHAFPGARFASAARIAYAAFNGVQSVVAAARRRLMRFGAKPPMLVVSYEVGQLIADLERIGFVDVGLDMRSSCVYGRKPR